MIAWGPTLYETSVDITYVRTTASLIGYQSVSKCNLGDFDGTLTVVSRTPPSTDPCQLSWYWDQREKHTGIILGDQSVSGTSNFEKGTNQGIRNIIMESVKWVIVYLTNIQDLLCYNCKPAESYQYKDMITNKAWRVSKTLYGDDWL